MKVSNRAPRSQRGRGVFLESQVKALVDWDSTWNAFQEMLHLQLLVRQLALETQAVL